LDERAAAVHERRSGVVKSILIMKMAGDGMPVRVYNCENMRSSDGYPKDNPALPVIDYGMLRRVCPTLGVPRARRMKR
jgi:hypothetical protein